MGEREMKLAGESGRGEEPKMVDYVERNTSHSRAQR